MASRTRRTQPQSSITLVAAQIPPAQPSPHAATPVAQSTSVAVAASQPTVGIEVPDYDVQIGSNAVARGRHTRLVTQYFEYDDKSGNPLTQEYREYLQLIKMAAAILPMCPREGKYLLIRQFRYTAWHNAIPNSPTPLEDGWLYEVIAGVIEKGDTPEQTVIREAQEEGGITLDPKDVRQVHECMMTPGITNEVITTFLGIVDQTITLGQTGLTNQGEHLRAKWMTADEIRQLHAQGQIRDAKTLIALYAARVL